MQTRTRNLVVNVSDEELAKVHAVAHAEDRSISAVIRGFIRDAYATRFGEIAPPKPRLKHEKK